MATGSGDDTVRIWDLRALRTQHTLPAHKSSISDLRFYRATAENPLTTLDAPVPPSSINGHTNGDGSSEIDMETSSDAPSADTASLPRTGLFLVTAGFDCHVRIWSADEWSMIKDLSTDSGKVMSADVSGDGKFIASASYSRSFHLFGGDNSL